MDVNVADQVRFELTRGRLVPVMSGSRLMSWRCRQRWSAEQVRCEIEAFSADRQAFSGSSM